MRITEILESVVGHHLLVPRYGLTSHVWIADGEIYLVVVGQIQLRLQDMMFHRMVGFR